MIFLLDDLKVLPDLVLPYRRAGRGVAGQAMWSRRRQLPALISRNWRRLSSQRGKIDIKDLKNRYGEKLGDVLLKNEIGITPQSFIESMWSFLVRKQYTDVLETYDILPLDHPYKSLDMHVIACIASSSSQLPKRIKKIGKTLRSQYPSLDPRLLPTLLITGYSLSNRLDRTESILVSWLRSLPNVQYQSLLQELDSGRNLSYEMSPLDSEMCDFKSQTEPSSPGLRVWHSLLYIYSIRGAWRQATAIFNYLKSSSKVDSIAYHRLITSVCYSNDLSSFSLAMNYYTEMKSNNITPHPLTLAPLLRCLSSWSREGVAYVDSLTQIADLTCSTCIQLSHMSDEQFVEYYWSKQSSLIKEDQWYYEDLDSPLRDRQHAIDEIFTQLMTSLACDRGLTVFAHSLKDHLQSHNVEVSNEGIMALIQGYCMANRWQDSLTLYHELSEKGLPMHGSRAYHWIADSMIRTNSKNDLAEFTTTPSLRSEAK